MNTNRYLKTKRMELGLTQSELALQSNVTLSTIQNLEQGKRKGNRDTWTQIDKVIPGSLKVFLENEDNNFLLKLLNNSDYHSIQNWEELSDDELADALFEKKEEKLNHHVLQELLEDKLNVSFFIESKYEPTYYTESDAGAVNFNGMLIPNGYGDGTNKIYILDSKEANFISYKHQVAFAYDEIKMSLYDCSNNPNNQIIIKSEYISIFKIAPKKFIITGKDITHERYDK